MAETPAGGTDGAGSDAPSTPPPVPPQSSPPQPAPSPIPTVPAGHRAHLDGLRAIAVYLVVAFHAGVGGFGGGHVGVDVFFVLSGYLVTGVLLRELVTDGHGDGRIRFGRFYARRVRRLLPAALVALVATAIAYRAVGSSIEVVDAGRGFQAAAIYLTNWYLIDEAASYFAADVAHSPILHFWSLAVEEQFYLLWPLLLSGLVVLSRRIGRHRWNVVRLVVAAAGLASVGWAWSIRATNPNRAYYGTDTRAYQLLLGAILAMTPWVIARLRRLGPFDGALVNGTVAAGGLGALVAISVWGTRTGPVVRGIAAALATVAVLAALETGRSGLVGRALSWAPIEYLGRISYSTYLWHWPVIVLARIVDPDRSPRALAALAVVVATGIASLSYQVLEHPIRSARRLDRIAWPVAVSGLALSLAAAVLVLPRILDRPSGAAEPTAPIATSVLDRFTPVPSDFDADAVYFGRYGDTTQCLDVPLSSCIAVDGSGPTIVLMGDSNAQMWIPAFEGAARLLDARLYVLLDDGCPWQRDIYRSTREVNATCRRLRERAYDADLPAIDPDLLVLANSPEWPGAGLQFNGRNAQHREAREKTRSSLDELGEMADQILVVEHKVLSTDPDFEPLKCLEAATYVEECRFVASTEPDFLEQDVRALAAERPELTSADFDHLMCPFLPICDSMVDGVPVYWNRSHLSEQWAATLDDEIAEYLRSEGLVPAEG